MKRNPLMPTIQSMLDARREKIVAARSAGWSVKMIAKEWGITRTRVYQIIEQDEAIRAKVLQETEQAVTQ